MWKGLSVPESGSRAHNRHVARYGRIVHPFGTLASRNGSPAHRSGGSEPFRLVARPQSRHGRGEPARRYDDGAGFRAIAPRNDCGAFPGASSTGRLARMLRRSHRPGVARNRIVPAIVREDGESNRSGPFRRIVRETPNRSGP